MLREVSTIKVKVVVHNAAASMDPAQLLKIKVPGTNVVAFTHVTSRSVVQLYASVAIVRPVNFAELKGGSGVPVAGSGVPAEQVLEDLCRQLWLGMPLATPGPGDHSAYSAYMCLPASISVNAAKFTGGRSLLLNLRATGHVLLSFQNKLQESCCTCRAREILLRSDIW